MLSAKLELPGARDVGVVEDQLCFPTSSDDAVIVMPIHICWLLDDQVLLPADEAAETADDRAVCFAEVYASTAVCSTVELGDGK